MINALIVLNTATMMMMMIKCKNMQNFSSDNVQQN